MHGRAFIDSLARSRCSQEEAIRTSTGSVGGASPGTEQATEDTHINPSLITFDDAPSEAMYNRGRLCSRYMIFRRLNTYCKVSDTMKSNDKSEDSKMKNFEDMDNKEFAFACLDELKKAGKLNTTALATMTNSGVPQPIPQQSFSRTARSSK